ncbi:MAG: sulfatase [Planctomycetaceae bacterium]|nr:sulfatase [Planctomycetaceae bacterium]
MSLSRVLLLLAVWMFWGVHHLEAQTASRPPNIVLFLVDDLGWRDLGCYGSTFYETPQIDQLALEGVRFTQAYAACHVCSPTRASILTGRYPARLRLTDWLPGRKDFPFQRLLNAEIEPHLPLAEVTLADLLREHGYATAHVGKWHLGEEPYGPTQQGFDLQVPRWNKGWPKVGHLAPFQMDGLQCEEGDYLTDRLTDEAEAFITAHQDRPFFLYLSHFAVHDPLQGRADLVAKYREKNAQRTPTSVLPYRLEGNPDDPSPLSFDDLQRRLKKPAWSGHRLLPERTIKIKQRQDNPEFAAMVEGVDESLGRVMNTLKELGLHERTIVVFCSDNGGMSAANFGNPERVIAERQLDRAYSTSNLPLRGAKGWLYEGGIRVPLIIRCPQCDRSGVTCEEPVISTDLFPTILELAGLPPKPDLHCDGVSLAPLMSGTGGLARDMIFWHFPHYSNHGQQSPGGAVRSGNYKLIEYFERGTTQLFNLRQDPGERIDLSQTEPEIRDRLLARLRAWRDDVGAAGMARNPEFATQTRD